MVVSSVERLDPKTGMTQSVTNPGIVLRAGHASRMLPDGSLMIVGRVGSDGKTVAQAEVLDPRDLHVRAAGRSALLERSGASLSVLADGTVLFSGGRSASGAPLADGAVYRPAARSWEPVSSEAVAALRTPASGNEPPRVAAAQPRTDEQGFDPNALIVLRFTRPVDPRSVRPDTVAVVGPEGSVKATVTPSDDGMLAFVAPVVPLAPGSKYSVVVRGVLSTTQTNVPLATYAFSTRDVGAISAEAVARARASREGASGGADPRAVIEGPSFLDQPLALQVAPQAEDDDETFVPRVRNFGGRWRSDKALPRDIEQRINDALSLKGTVAYENEYRAFRSALRLRTRSREAARSTSVSGLSGQVLRLSDRPLANALVTVAGRRLRTDAQGRFQVFGLAPGHYDVFVDGSCQFAG